jgi:hypothetical protein
VPTPEVPSPTPGEDGTAGGQVVDSTPRPGAVVAPILIAKLDDRGTRTRGDDRLLRSATFRILFDDGDQRYEPQDDRAVFEGVARRGWLAFLPQEAGGYWIVEVTAPSGYQPSQPIRVTIALGRQPRCLHDGGRVICSSEDEPESNGYLVVAIRNSPVGLPPTDERGRATR